MRIATPSGHQPFARQRNLTFLNCSFRIDSSLPFYSVGDSEYIPERFDWTLEWANQKSFFRTISKHFQTLGRFCLELLILFKTSTMIIPVIYWNTSPSDDYHVILVT